MPHETGALTLKRKTASASLFTILPARGFGIRCPMNRHHQKRRAAIFHVLNEIELPSIEAEPDAEALENIRIEIEVDDDGPLASEDDQ